MSDRVSSKLELRRDGLLREEPDDLALGRLDLFGHDDEGVALRRVPGPGRPLDLVVVGDGERPQADLPGGGQDRLHGAGAVLGEVGVDVQVGVDPVGPRWARRPPGAGACGSDSSPMPRTCREWPATGVLAGQPLPAAGGGEGLLVDAPPAGRPPPPWSAARRPERLGGRRRRTGGRQRRCRPSAAVMAAPQRARLGGREDGRPRPSASAVAAAPVAPGSRAPAAGRGPPRGSRTPWPRPP